MPRSPTSFRALVSARAPFSAFAAGGRPPNRVVAFARGPVLALALFVGAAASAWCQVEGTAPAAPPAVEAALPAQDGVGQADWRERLERNRRTSFNAHSADLALETLASSSDARLRPAALFALGASGERSMAPRLESWALEGSPAEREAAILGLFDGGLASFELLARVARSSTPEVRDAAMLSLARSPGERERAWFERLCEGDGPGVEGCARMRAFAVDPSAGAECSVARTWIALRWDAARRFGLIDGEPWRAHLFARLVADEGFLDDLVYGAASDVRRLGTADHFLAVALEPGAPRRLRAVVNAIPAELDRMVGAGVWFPADQEEWAELLYGIDDRRLESLAVDILRQARAFPDLSAYAALLLVRGGKLEGLSLLELDIASPDPLKRRRIAEVLGGTRELRYVELLGTLLADPSPDVRGAALVAQMRLGHPPASDEVLAELEGDPGPERAAIVTALARLVHVEEIAALLREHLGRLNPAERLRASIELARQGDATVASDLGDAVTEDVLRSELGVPLVQALGRSGSNADLAVLFALFPLEDEPEVDLEIARAMCARRDPAVLPILRAALWRSSFDRGVLAAALMAHVGGIDSLRIELERPPRGARPEDVRRVGFALGEWGGTAELERLARRRTAADPAVQGALLGALGARTR